ncbi:uncharacterized protein LOC113558210 [Rhopalosiphum maidis]|uniref:uncharacterized protein LOC113558210 n=1 Tax=Rhopalosiphum maidis TaxID=43146 RepID=UPI000F001D3F|nr:uncharacterized protein LOC113558210 [Rhopalosiphum maidis]
MFVISNCVKNNGINDEAVESYGVTFNENVVKILAETNEGKDDTYQQSSQLTEDEVRHYISLFNIQIINHGMVFDLLMWTPNDFCEDKLSKQITCLSTLHFKTRCLENVTKVFDGKKMII